MKAGPRLRVEHAQVLHGCRQLVSRDVALSRLTSETLVLSCQHVMVGTLRRPPVLNRKKVGTTSSHHGLYAQGCTRATMRRTKGSQLARGSKPQKAPPSSDCRLQLACMKPESLVIADQLCRGESVPEPCTHRPSSHESGRHPKSLSELARDAGAEGVFRDWD